jgi:hypothetical protein
MLLLLPNSLLKMANSLHVAVVYCSVSAPRLVLAVCYGLMLYSTTWCLRTIFLAKQGDACPPTKDPMRHLFDELAADWDAEEDAIAKIELEHPPTLELLEISEVCQISYTLSNVML